MPFIIQYLLKLSIALGLVYIFYALFLRKLTFYNWNRWYLTGYSLLSFLIAFIDISPLLEKNDLDNGSMIRMIPMVGNYIQKEASYPNWFTWNSLLWVLLAGMLFISLRLALQFFSYRRLRRSASLLVEDRLKIYHVDGRILPFSFGNSIFINQHQHSEEELKEIIRHEFVHVKQRHTADILFAEVLCMLNWYNPFAWLIRRSIRQNLEFIADNQVLANGVNRKQYQYLLLKVTGMPQFSIASNFNLSSLKKRIVMMNKIKSARVQIVRFLFLLPLAAGMLLSFRTSRHYNATVQPAYRFVVTDTIPPSDIDEISINNKKVRIKLKSGSEKFYDLDKAEDRERYKKEIGELSRALTPAVPAAPPAPQTIEVKPPAEPPAPAPPAPPAPPTPPAPEKKSRHEKIAETTVTAPADEVIEVPVKPERAVTIVKPMNTTVSVRATNQDPLVILDGVEVSPGVIKDLSPHNIEKVDVLKETAATSRYGSKGEHGVVIITTKVNVNTNTNVNAKPAATVRLKPVKDSL